MKRVPQRVSPSDLPPMTDPPRPPPADTHTDAERPVSDRHRAPPLLLYDGLCGFCDGTVRFVLGRDARGAIRFAPLQGPTARAVLARHPALARIDSLILVEHDADGETVSTRSEAVLRIARYLGGVWAILAVLRLVPAPLRDWAYDLFARHRHRVFGRHDECPLPPTDVRARFLP